MYTYLSRSAKLSNRNSADVQGGDRNLRNDRSATVESVGRHRCSQCLSLPPSSRFTANPLTWLQLVDERCTFVWARKTPVLAQLVNKLHSPVDLAGPISALPTPSNLAANDFLLSSADRQKRGVRGGVKGCGLFGYRRGLFRRRACGVSCQEALNRQGARAEEKIR